MALTIRLDKDTKKKFRALLENPFRDIRQYWATLALMIDQDTQRIFKNQGWRKNKPGAWDDFSPNTLATRKGTFKIRYGTDLRGRAKGTYIPGKLRGGNIRRYSLSSKLLQASGLFRKSFGILSLKRHSMQYGTRHQLAEDIMSVKNRGVLFVTPQDEQRYLNQFRIFYLKGMRI